MLKTRDKALISLTALFQAALGIFGFLLSSVLDFAESKLVKGGNTNV